MQQQLGGAVGFANPSIYALHRSQPSVFRDVTPQNPPKALAFSSPDTNKSYLVTLDRDSSLATAPGYDDVAVTSSDSPRRHTCTPQGSARATSISITRTPVRLNDGVNAQSSNTSGHVLHISRQGKRRQRRACDRTAQR